MADPSKYERTYSFTDFQAGNPSKPLPGIQVDNELENVEQSLGEAIDAIKDVRRSDGKLKNGIVTIDSLDPQVAAGVGTGALASAEAAAASAEASAASASAASGYANNALTSRNEASGFADDSAAAASLSQTARDHAYLWASEAENVQVNDGVNPPGYSAYHWAQTMAEGLELATTAVQRSGDETKTGNFRLTDGMLKVFKNLQILPTSEDGGGMIVSTNRSGTDGETNIRNMYVNPVGLAYTFSQTIEEGVSERDILRLYQNGQIKGEGGGWLEPLAGQTESIGILTLLSRPGSGMPLVAAVRTSDLVAPAYMAGQAACLVGINDRPRGLDFDTTFLAWGAYHEARRHPGSGRAHGSESGTLNIDDGTDPSSTADPFNYAQDNHIISAHHSAGRPDHGNAQRDIDVAEEYVQNGPVGKQVSYRVGHLWGDKSIREVNGVAPVMRMPTRYQIEWWTAAGLVGYLRGEQSASAEPVGVVIRDHTIDFEHSGTLSVGISATGIRTPATNGGYDSNSVYIGSTTADQQYQFQSSPTALFLNRNEGSTGTPSWSAIGNWNATTGAYTSVSDETLKQDFRDFDRDIPTLIAGLAEASSFYRMKSAPQAEYFGFLAQRLRAVLPEAIHEIKQPDSVHKARSILHVEDRPIIAALAVAVEHLKKQFEKLERAV